MCCVGWYSAHSHHIPHRVFNIVTPHVNPHIYPIANQCIKTKPKQSYFSLCSDTLAEVEIPANSLRSQVFVSLSETETSDVDLEANPPNTEYISNFVELNPRVSSLVTSAFLKRFAFSC